MSSQASPFQQPHNWFLVRGLAREAGHWGHFPTQLAQAFPQGKIICLDLPGAGVFRAHRTPMSLPAMTRWVREEFKKTLEAQRADGIDPRGERKNYVLCISLGGMVLTEWMRQFDNDWHAAVLVNTSLRGYSPLWRRMQPTALLQLLRAVVSRSDEERESRIIRVVVNDIKKRADLLKIWLELRRARPISIANSLRQIIAAILYRPARPKKLPPILLINSLGDRLAHPSCSERIARAWDIETTTHSWAGHDLTTDDPEWLLQRIQDWKME